MSSKIPSHEQPDYSFVQNFYHVVDDRPNKLTRCFLEKTRVILVGHHECRTDNFKAVAQLLNSFATHEDLLLIEYQDRGTWVKSDTRGIRVLDLLKSFGLNKNLTIKGWDETSYGPQIGLMLTGKRPLDLDLLITKRNKSLAQAVNDDFKRYRKIFVLAGTLHFCLPIDVSLRFRELILKTPVYKELHIDLQKKRPVVIVPINKDKYAGLGDLTFYDHGPRRPLRSCNPLKIALCTIAILGLYSLSFISISFGKS